MLVYALVLYLLSLASAQDFSYADCLEISDQNERQKCITYLAYLGTIYPTSALITAGQIPTPWYSDDLRGRLIPTGIFDSPLESLEYFYGLTALPSLRGPNANGEIIQVFKVVPYYETSQDDIVAARYDLMFGNSPTFDCIANLTIEGFHRFDDAGEQIISYDVTFLRMGAWVDELAICQNEVIDSIELICDIHDEVCHDDNQQYYSCDRKELPKCKQFLQSIPEGNFYEAISNTIVCRRLHALLAQVDPDVHCPHIGPSGGGACEDFPYELFYQFYY